MSISGISSENNAIQSLRTQSVPRRNPVNQYMSEVKSFAKINSIEDITDEDIQDALRFGTSLFVDQTV